MEVCAGYKLEGGWMSELEYRRMRWVGDPVGGGRRVVRESRDHAPTSALVCLHRFTLHDGMEIWKMEKWRDILFKVSGSIRYKPEKPVYRTVSIL